MLAARQLGVGRRRIMLLQRFSARSNSSSSLATQATSRTAAILGVSLAIGFGLGRYSYPDKSQQQILPDGLPRTCCEDHEALTEAQQKLPDSLRWIVGEENVLDGRKLNTKTIGFLKGARLGEGSALCIVTPRKLHHVAEVVQLAIDADCVVLVQGQNTGLTGGSVPHAKDRPTVVLSMKYLDAIFPLDDGKRVVCLAGAGLASVRHRINKLDCVLTL